MKKSIIAGAGIAAVSLAGMPFLGAFAAQGEISDTVKVTINGSCSVGSTNSSTGGGNSFTTSIDNGNIALWEGDGSGTGATGAGGKIFVSCNNSNGWNVKAVGGDGGATANTNMTSTSGKTIATGTGTSGNSAWAFKITGTSAISGFDDWSLVPGSAVKVAEGSAAVVEEEITTNYRVFIGLGQEADTYTGKVTYTVAEGV